ncbi:lipoprotein signal peptidase [Fictibacillus macauensis ZFHKF-1]|uniref:Lipoprotein signal peptidase n=1 Tax=Fictibacillus macauensis ZFHKF-1 TaxID=1196324 RepID=I8UDP6_9BACL|nr:signal peptidase II [Fictibacillus macauensis]EIT85015.1 lipoprotein signal peptidase [Fictibacillus macauensis ZFHKF-1]
MIYYLIALLVLAIDQASKWWIVKNMHYGESRTVIENVFYITSHRNRGAAFGILQNQMWFFIIITLVVIAVLVYYMQKQRNGQPLLKIALGLVLGGAIGNFLDRIVRKEVVDFMDIRLGAYHYPIFNIADSALVVGVILLFIYVIMDSKQKKENVNGAHRS